MKALIALAALLGGCAVSIDVTYLLRGPDTRTTVGEKSLPAEGVVAWREVALDPSVELVCYDIVRPRMRRGTATQHLYHPNGDRLGMAVLTVLESGAGGAYLATKGPRVWLIRWASTSRGGSSARSRSNQRSCAKWTSRGPRRRSATSS